MDKVYNSFYANSAEQLVESLCEIDLGRWRDAAMAAIAAAQDLKSWEVLSATSTSVKSVRTWQVLDMLETAGHRLSGREAHDVIRGAAERRSIQMITRHAVVALLFSELFKPEDLKAITDPFLALIPPA
ncbi:MAG: hypothetical protein M3P26_13975 [Gemmatimonadota bacterium]|nr:hypothetical protein [Gemmatimonadota bacterium]